MPSFYPVTLSDEGFIRGPARFMWAGTTIGFPTTVANIVNLSTYVAMSGWNDLGATKTGVTISHSGAEESFEVDQVLGEFESLPTSWEMSVQTSLAEATLDRLAIAWEERDPSSVAFGTNPSEKQMDLGAPLSFTRRRLAVLYRRSNGKIRATIFRKAQLSPQESTTVYNKTGEQQSFVARFRCLQDLSITDELQRFGAIFDQQ